MKEVKKEEDIRDELSDIAPGFPVKKSPDPPIEYFETFPDLVLNRWREEESHSRTKNIFWWRVTGIAALLTGLLIGGFWFFSPPTSIQTNDVSAVEAYQYINENIDEFEVLIESDDMRINDNQMDIPHEAIEEYLIEELHGSDPEELF